MTTADTPAGRPTGPTCKNCSKVCAHGGKACCKDPHPIICPRHLLFAMIAYRIQADRFGDLDHETRQLLDRSGAKETGTAMSARLVSFDQKRTELTPGTILVREWDRRSQRVMVMADGFAWNGPRSPL